MINVMDLTLCYGETKALNSVSFSLAKGSLTTIVGPSGCGKSSLLLALAGLIQPQQGVMDIFGETVSGVRDKTAILLQDVGLFPWKTVVENIAFILRDRGFSRQEAKTVACEALAMVDMQAYQDRYVETLSGGQRQRVGFAKALALKPDVILFDEATSALDAFTAEQVQDVLKTLHAKNAWTIIYVTHKIDEAVYLGDQVLVMKQGSIVQQFDGSKETSRDEASFFSLCLTVKEALR